MPNARQMTTSELLARVRPHREIDGCSAVLLPHTAAGEIDWAGFEHLLRRTADAGLTPAINMDTGFGPQIGADGRREVLAFSRRTLGEGAKLIAGAGVFGIAGDPLGAYRAAVGEICAAGATPIIFQSEWLSSKHDAALADAYRAILAGAPAALAFELGTMFAPFGRIYSLDEYRRLLDIEQIVGAKHSSLDRFQELDRLELRDATRPDFKVYTGNDLAIDMVMYGSDYLLGLSAFDPDAFALRDRYWRDGDPRFYPLNDALQALGMVGFRNPVPAYKDSAAAYLTLTGHLRDAHVHPDCPRRPAWEPEILEPLRALIAQHAGA